MSTGGGGHVADSIIVRLIGDATNLMRTMNNATRSITSSANVIQRSAQRIASSINLIGSVATAGAAAGVAMFARRSINEFREFDKAVTKSLSIVAGADAKMRSSLEKTALTLSTKSVYSATEIAEAYYQMISAGFDVEQTAKSIGVAINFATAGSQNLEQSVKQLAKATFAMYDVAGKSGEQIETIMKRVADVIAQGANLVLAEIPELQEALTNAAAPAAKLLGYSIEETVAGLSVYIQKGNSMATSSEHLAIALRLTQEAFQRHSDVWANLGRRMGIDMNLYDKTTGKIKHLADIVDMLSQALKGMSDRERFDTMISMGFMAMHQRAFLPLLGSADMIRKFTKELEKEGEHERIAAAQMQSFDAQMKIMSHTFENFRIELGKRLAPTVSYFTGLMKGLFNLFLDANSQTQSMIFQYTEMAGKIALIAGAIAGVTMVMPAFTSALALAFSPAGIVFVGVAGLLQMMGKLKPLITEITGLAKDTLSGVESELQLNVVRKAAREETVKRYGEPIAQLTDKRLAAQNELEKREQAVRDAKESVYKQAKQAALSELSTSEMGQSMFGDAKLKAVISKKVRARIEELTQKDNTVSIAQGEQDTARRNLEQINKEIDEAKKRVDIGNEIGKGFKKATDFITPFIDKFKDANKTIDESKKKSEALMDQHIDAAMKYDDMAKKFQHQIDIHNEEQKRGVALSGAEREVMEAKLKMQDQMNDGIKEYNAQINLLKSQAAANVPGANTALKKAQDDLQTYKERMGAALESPEMKRAQDLAALITKQQKEREELNKLKSLEEQYKDPQKKYAEQIARIGKLYSQNKISAEGYTKAMKEARKELEANDTTLKKIQDRLKTGHKVQVMKWDKTEVAAMIAEQNAELAMHGIKLPALPNGPGRKVNPLHPAMQGQARQIGRMSQGRFQKLKDIEYHNSMQKEMTRHDRALRRVNMSPGHDHQEQLKRVQEVHERNLAGIYKTHEATGASAAQGPGRIAIMLSQQRKEIIARYARTTARIGGDNPEAYKRATAKYENQLASLDKRKGLLTSRAGGSLSSFAMGERKEEVKLLTRIANAAEKTAKGKGATVVRPANLGA